MTKLRVASENMAETELSEGAVVNDYSMVVASVNGSGSQTANLAMIRALFRMGIPVSSKNLFPSNIQGLPTWFIVRANADGYTARREKSEILVAMNLVTFSEDLDNLPPGGVCFYADHFPRPRDRKDVTFYPMPVQDLVKKMSPPREMRDYIANMAYVGVVAEMLGIELTEIEAALAYHFRGKKRPIELNMQMVHAAASWARENLVKSDPYRVERMEGNENQILIDGNTAAALGSIYGGVNFAAWYPITPASSLADGLEEHLPRLRKDPESGKATYAVIQAEDEIAAIGMAVGAGWTGARAMTSTSGPGLSLMAEFAGLAFFAEIPVVIWDVQRMGPSTGLPTRTSQGDLMFIRFLGHGDTRQIMLIPGSVAECFEFGWRAFDLAERLQTPIFVLSDLDLGKNIWMSETFIYPDQPIDHGKILGAEDLDRISEFARYRDVDGDGITYRTLPGTDHPLAAYFTRGTGHTDRAMYSERSEDWEENMARLLRKHETARQYLPHPVLQTMDGAGIGILGYGSTDPAIQEARDLLAENGLAVDYLRVRAIPFNDEVGSFIQAHDRVYIVEMNTDGQMRMLLQIAYPGQAEKLVSAQRNNGLPLSASWIFEEILAREEG
jgi:2-oxoglutarate ferredoxin oxidoreductase subunit alpha